MKNILQNHRYMKRYISLDILRGLSIFGMVFSAIIPHGVLPAWMYHIQNPPPAHSLDMTVSGISWVDLVFPIFIFCMGVAIPLAGRRRLDLPDDTGAGRRYLAEIFERFVMLWLFSYLYVFLNFSTVKGWWPQLATIVGFLALFPLYMQLSKTTSKRKLIIYRVAGLILTVAIIAYGHFKFDEVISLNRRGIIIFLLAFIYLFGALIWYFTRNSNRMRAAAFAAVLLFAAITMFFEVPQKLYTLKDIRWIVNIEYIYFLLILIPATYLGDLLHKKLNSTSPYDPVGESRLSGGGTTMPLILMAIYIVWLMVALYKGYYLVNIFVSLVFVSKIHQLIEQRMPVYTKESAIASILGLAGAVLVMIEGGITKVPCTIAYCFITTSISIYLLIIIDRISYNAHNSYLARIFSGSGSNPLMSYIAFGSFVMPLFKITGLVIIYQAAYPADYPWIGVLRSAAVVLLTMAAVAAMSERKIFWRA
ncbi:MAG: hypothetical protein CVU12_01555 [Bacteroidetes bacterium HGW-Bacteroidetes-7]|nr:MAG: hypothetical protein CVU12_01555 [Bacteroidetes bacterium HGW-Bacteroidetes-7]